MRFTPDSVPCDAGRKNSALWMSCGQGFIKFSVIAIDVVEKPNLIFLVHCSRAVDNHNRNSREEVHLKIIFLAVHRGLHPLQIPARIVPQYPGNEILRLLYPNASVAEIADV